MGLKKTNKTSCAEYGTKMATKPNCSRNGQKTLKTRQMCRIGAHKPELKKKCIGYGQTTTYGSGEKGRGLGGAEAEN